MSASAEHGECHRTMTARVCTHNSTQQANGSQINYSKNDNDNSNRNTASVMPSLTSLDINNNYDTDFESSTTRQSYCNRCKNISIISVSQTTAETKSYLVNSTLPTTISLCLLLSTIALNIILSLSISVSASSAIHHAHHSGDLETFSGARRGGWNENGERFKRTAIISHSSNPVEQVSSASDVALRSILTSSGEEMEPSYRNANGDDQYEQTGAAKTRATLDREQQEREDLKRRIINERQIIQYHDQWPAMAGKCHKRTLNFCARVLPFNTTVFPNIIGDTNRFEVKRSLPFFGFIARSQCNKRLDQLLCMLLEPPCHPETNRAVPPCKKFCRVALEGCAEYIPATLALSSVFDCRRYPDSNDPDVCVNLARGNTCAHDEFKCPDKTCIPRHWLCDGVRDCVFAADEANCTDTNSEYNSVCSTEEFQCDGKCVPKSWKCDGERDCLDGRDEESCEARPQCGPDRFKCADGNGCIPKRWVCDGKAECRDGSDEQGCRQKECTENDFKCDNGICIPKVWRCDHQMDCKDGSDERNCVYPVTTTTTTTTTTTLAPINLSLDYAAINSSSAVASQEPVPMSSDNVASSDDLSLSPSVAYQSTTTTATSDSAANEAAGPGISNSDNDVNMEPQSPSAQTLAPVQTSEGPSSLAYSVEHSGTNEPLTSTTSAAKIYHYELIGNTGNQQLSQNMPQLYQNQPLAYHHSSLPHSRRQHLTHDNYILQQQQVNGPQKLSVYKTLLQTLTGSRSTTTASGHSQQPLTASSSTTPISPVSVDSATSSAGSSSVRPNLQQSTTMSVLPSDSPVTPTVATASETRKPDGRYFHLLSRQHRHISGGGGPSFVTKRGLQALGANGHATVHRVRQHRLAPASLHATSAYLARFMGSAANRHHYRQHIHQQQQRQQQQQHPQL
ncbi:Low-density lipoprotein receptor-related protein 1, partial [Fragariocoptes setiger]